MKKATIAFVFAALSVGTMGCNKSKADTATPDEGTKTETPPPAETPADGEAVDGDAAADDVAAPEGEAAP